MGDKSAITAAIQVFGKCLKNMYLYIFTLADNNKISITNFAKVCQLDHNIFY